MGFSKMPTQGTGIHDGVSPQSLERETEAAALNRRAEQLWSTCLGRAPLLGMSPLHTLEQERGAPGEVGI